MDALRKLPKLSWDDVAAAPVVRPFETGDYACNVTALAFRRARTGSEGVEVTFAVVDGTHKDETIRHTIWIRGAALSPDTPGKAKTFLGLLGFTSFPEAADFDEKFHKDDLPKVDPGELFVVVIQRNDDNPLGAVATFYPIK